MPVLPLVASTTVCPGLSARALRRLDDGESQAVLDRSQWVEGLDFHIEVDAIRSEAVDADNRRVSNGFQNALKSRHPNLRLFRTALRGPWTKRAPFLNLSRPNSFPKEPCDHEAASLHSPLSPRPISDIGSACRQLTCQAGLEGGFHPCA
jgi:hypothetical protein